MASITNVTIRQEDEKSGLRCLVRLGRKIFRQKYNQTKRPNGRNLGRCGSNESYSRRPVCRWSMEKRYNPWAPLDVSERKKCATSTSKKGARLCGAFLVMGVY
uniref:Uncharacterized protein n=1 Tax=Fusarium oxysporum (strain Fo5176) TaxID=660025 RepID=A0A0D2Y844_FUSOF